MTAGGSRFGTLPSSARGTIPAVPIAAIQATPATPQMRTRAADPGHPSVPPSYDEDGWYAPADAAGPADTSHPSGPLPGTHGYGGIGGARLYGAPVYAEADYRGAGSGDTQYEDGPYEDGQYGAAPHREAEYNPAGYGPAHQPGAAHYAGVLYNQQPYAGEGDSGEHYAEAGYAPHDPDGSHPGQQARLPAGRVRRARGRGSRPGGFRAA